jgi:uncharacterized protein with FMN-binding domain
MRRITLWLVSTVAALVLLFSYRTSTGVAGPAGSDDLADGPREPGATEQPKAPAASSSGPAESGAGETVVDGSVAQTRWGPVQVRVMITAGTITDVVALRFPDAHPLEVELNTNAAAVLRERVLVAQNADVDLVSGATVTSEGYIESLQAALDAAGFPR